MYLTNFAIIGKSFLISILGVQENYKREVVKEKVFLDYSKCKGCEFFNTKDDEIINYCRNYCDKPEKKVLIKNEYYNEANRYHIPTTERLSKSQIKQILLYHFLDVDNNGIVKGASLKEVANILKCDVKTVKNNNERFMELHHAYSTGIIGGEFSVLLRKYKEYYLPKSKGGTGYITMPLEIFKKLLEVDDVNALRIELRKLLEYDRKNISSKTQVAASYTYRDVKRFLPKYLGYKGAIDSAMDKCSEIFENIRASKGIAFKLKEKYDYRIIKERIIEKATNAYDEFFDVFNFSTKDFASILQLSTEYSLEVIKETLRKIAEGYLMRGIEVRNLGGLMRTIIRRNKNSFTTVLA